MTLGRLRRLATAVGGAPSPEELELEREMEYLVEAEESFGRDEVAE